MINDKSNIKMSGKNKVKSPPPSFRPPPPFSPPPQLSSPIAQRRLAAAVSGSSNGNSKGGSKRPVERLEDDKITRFGEPGRLRSPTPNSKGGKMSNGINGNGADADAAEIDFLDLLEKEEADFAEQITKQKSFLQVSPYKKSLYLAVI